MTRRNFYHMLAKRSKDPRDPEYDDSFDAEKLIDDYDSYLEDKWDDRRCEQ